MSALDYAARGLRETWPVRHHPDRAVRRQALTAIRCFLRVLRGSR